jgi:hypothetical protein
MPTSFKCSSQKVRVSTRKARSCANGYWYQSSFLIEDHFRLQFGLSHALLLTVPDFLCLHHLNAPVKRSELVEEKLDLVSIGIGIHLTLDSNLVSAMDHF